MSTKLNKNLLPKCKMFVSVKVPCVLYLCGTRVEAVPGDFFTLTPNDSENPFVFGIEIERILNIASEL